MHGYDLIQLKRIIKKDFSDDDPPYCVVRGFTCNAVENTDMVRYRIVGFLWGTSFG